MFTQNPSLSSAGTPLKLDRWRRSIRPIGVYMLYGLASRGDKLLSIDALRGYLVEIDPDTDNTTILNPNHLNAFVGATGLAATDERVWFTRDESVYTCTWDDLTPQELIALPYEANSVAVWGSTLYVSCQKSGYIHIYNGNNGTPITKLLAPGMGVESLTIRDEELWVTDIEEQTVYCMDRATGEIRFSVLTPFERPTGISFHAAADPDETLLYVVYSGEEAYIRDDPNSDPPQQLAWRDRTFIHPLHYHYNAKDHYAVSNGYLIEMSYVEELSPLDEVELENLDWRIALPSDTHRQKVRSVEAVGMPFTEEMQGDQRVAVFHFDRLQPHEGRIFGWKALIEVRSIKYHLTPRDTENAPPLPPEMQAVYLVDNDDLKMNSEIVQRSAKEAIGSETNILRQVLRIRNYVYDRLSYGIKPKIDPPDVVLVRGVGSCGEYVGVLLALCRLNGIACRTIGRYKCPPAGDRQNLPLQPDFNHVWLEFYIPGLGWVPMESNPDDIQENGPYPTRFFMGLAWYHVEIGKGISFEKLRVNHQLVDKDVISLGDLAINHVRFTILQELPPPND
ncbi:transglutaminase domain-containing protein [Desertifilum sp. FACHB-1129]|uniref:Transglutaminase n=1 Tax=Desertifilum tharense IPPAS B-1220 TaxID=1781255 RepID=A0A1E5QLA3_9CYAN|nr:MULTISPECIES: transglutaminase-like domain-containing protein [Desertifilum]MDA0209938.1 transglutaminase-like domain-containing protein [Cyanobacteria bacterium FC1]MBD2313794.1 transglutaminase domain-containing protein [Desertifilum sp. FACHB-1129]MBD2324495.1 transglutaminase domain-containing protein [Desertifilum sp. FACHB-866]MBD2334509.1 transglutaminase domain-containing protein [Desertifilum sp. FACHB-868]OEJ75455.1 transglutaminase [Desertifilum tharense IPPAS B-1220]